MRWNRLAAACLVVITSLVITSAACLAETPDWSGNRQPPAQLFQGRLLGGQNWWTRFGEPVNSVALAQADASPSDKTGPLPMYGNDGGYVYSPGACDYSPPCIWNLWGGYFSNPCRCGNHHLLHKHCGCGAGGNMCGGGCNICDPCNAGCGGGHQCRLFHKMWGNNCGCGVSCATASCGCAAPSCAAPSCGAPTCSSVADCGCCKPLCGKCRPCHHCGKWSGFMAHWNSGCDSCSSPVSCGCTTPTPAMPTSEKQAADSSSLIPFPVPPAL
ncbi:MAG TPA: hypothetical protein VGI40_12580 [Pirellulaceae bacterium]